MAKVKYYAKENSSIGTHSFYAVPKAKGQYIPLHYSRPPMGGGL